MRRLKWQFDCFDRLPRELRDALANAAFDWDATLIAEGLDLGTAAATLVARIREEDQRRVSVDNYVMYGPDHPGSPPHVPANMLKFYRYPTGLRFWWARS